MFLESESPIDLQAPSQRENRSVFTNGDLRKGRSIFDNEPALAREPDSHIDISALSLNTDNYLEDASPREGYDTARSSAGGQPNLAPVVDPKTLRSATKTKKDNQSGNDRAKGDDSKQ